MLKRNLFAIIIIMSGLVFTSNAFGQWHPEIDKIKAGKPAAVKSPYDVATGQIKSPRDVATGQSSELLTEIAFPAITNQRRKTTNQYNPKEIGIDKVANRKNSKWEGPEFDASKNLSAKPKGYNLGDTATHEFHRKRQN